MLTTDFVPGTPDWLDLGAPDVDAAVTFYSNVFGWTFQSAGPEAGGYGFFLLDGKTVAAVGPLMAEGASPSWTAYFHTNDADATRADVERAGGAVRLAPMDVFTAGRMAQFTDPAGADFAVWQPGDVTGLETVMESDALCWTELYTTDAAAAKEFYRSVFSWQYEDMPMDAGISYTVVSSPGGGAEGDSGQGGIMQLPQENLDAGSGSEWHPYFGVTDCDATFEEATRGGARSLMPPTDVPGVGRLAMLLDPAGAPFALIKGDPEMT
ncbi:MULTISPECIES: VOC family protein [unclassified Streptomyces]|uniref:VOC family protein n=1 Tax=unclassified Streptomyces TaxID=2593676 RepID=UPI002DD7C378|nr:MULTISPECIES: VOC family protein [unclassified Streptomyces]WSA93961.1 VOC family protein [Streptomyces sp. NBC_01795]WSB78387.1 VOC family protein [Streptomyces sp. NBC_01775]WSS13410.1 VOC family protein [Streptomyces sp. NBC_01186]WSS42199.1 VOC family protein [Streptomyces sp. NBC_01187]